MLSLPSSLPLGNTTSMRGLCIACSLSTSTSMAKPPLCLKALEIGIDPSRLMIDAAQAGVVYGGGVGYFVAQDSSMKPIEVKGCLCRRGKRRAFSFRNIIVPGAMGLLFFVGRLRNQAFLLKKLCKRKIVKLCGWAS